jgi:hypothetical protein
LRNPEIFNGQQACRHRPLKAGSGNGKQARSIARRDRHGTPVLSRTPVLMFAVSGAHGSRRR